MESAFTAEVDAAITAATEQGLGVVLSMHHADGLMTGEPGAVDRLGALRVSRDLETAASWAAARGLALYVGEFGTHHAADAGDRTAWTSWVRVELERLNLPWAYWDFRTDFGVYDAQRKRWRHHLLDALISELWKR